LQISLIRANGQARNVYAGAALSAAAGIADLYLKPSLTRVYGDAAMPLENRDAGTIAQWIMRTRPQRINASELRRHAKLPGLRKAARVMPPIGWWVGKQADELGEKKDKLIQEPQGQGGEHQAPMAPGSVTAKG
jgi:hypothetical protein